MRKLLVFVALFAISGVSYAQDAQVNRSLSFYLDSFSGDLTKDLEGNPRLFKGNEFEFGMTYSQNFATVPWLSMWVKGLVVTGINPAYDKDDKYMGNDGSVYILPWAQPRVQLGLNFGGHAILAIDTRGLMAECAYYSLNFGNAGSLTFVQILEFWAFPQFIGDYMKDEDGNLVPRTGRRTTIVDLFALRMDYGISFAPGWRFNTKLAFRFGGDQLDLTADIFRDSFQIRWENQLVWSVTDKFYMWTQIRYRIDNLANKALKTDHRVMLQAGLGYSFDFSGN
ncbi:MAG: hypothetical protein ACRC0X_04765 [Brevinema sp.]